MRWGHLAPSFEFQTDGSYVRYEVSLKITVLWDVTPFSPVDVYTDISGEPEFTLMIQGAASTEMTVQI